MTRADCKLAAAGRLFAVGGLALALSAVFAPQARARPSDPFTPRFSVSTSTTQAGDHPDLTIEMHRPPNHCPGWLEEPPVNTCALDDLYIEQDLKRMAIGIPPGLVADASAAPYCEAGRIVVDESNISWGCRNPAAVPVGELFVVSTWCQLDPWVEGSAFCTVSPDLLAPDGTPIHGGFLAERDLVYMERPHAGEQGRLVFFWLEEQIRTETSVKLRESDAGIDSVADGIGDLAQFCRPGGDGQEACTKVKPGQIADMVLTLHGATGADRGHPLLTNPTFCDPQAVRAEFQGYENNSVDLVSPGVAETFVQGWGDGQLATGSAAYRATDCDPVPFNPRLDLRLDDAGPDRAPAIDATVRQGPGEATTGRATVTFPKDFKVNAKNAARHCSPADLAARTCPPESRIGTVAASSPLLPIGEELKGGVYLAGLTGDSIKVEAQLGGFANLTIRAQGRIGGDLTLINDFNDLPAVPVSEFRLHLDGGEKGLIRTPKTCGPQTIGSLFVSHSGKEVRQEIPVEVDCRGNEPRLDASVSPTTPGSLSRVELSLQGAGHRIRTVRFGLARQLRWGLRRIGASGEKGAPSAGRVSYETPSGELATALKARPTGRGSVAFTPKSTKLLTGQRQSLAGFQASLFHASARRSRQARGANGRRPRMRQSDLKLSGIPSGGVSSVGLQLRSARRAFFIRTPKACGDPLNFVAVVTTVAGRKFAVSDDVRLRGRRCPGSLYRGRR